MCGKTGLNLFKRFIHFVALFTLLSTPRKTVSWEIAVATDRALNLFDLDGNIEYSPEETKNLTELKALTFDPVNQRLIFSVIECDASVFAFDLENRSLTPIVPVQSHDVLGVAYDFTTSTLYWTDGRGHSIWRKSLSNETSPAQTMLYLENEITIGIAISFCKRLLFWTNSNISAGSIDRSNLNGTNHTQIVTKDLFQPLAVAVDEADGKLYWTDDHEGIYYRIERSNLDGTNRELLIRRKYQEPVGITATNNAIYWTDSIQKNVWVLSTDMSFPNHTKARLEPDVFHQYSNYEPYGIVAYSDGNFECDVKVHSKAPSHNEPESDAGEVKDPGASYCLNSGNFDKSSCKCPKGFSGERCEVSLCHNYCLNEGTCVLDGNGSPTCKCTTSFVGARCDRDVCDDFCMNDGRCYLNDTFPVCSCREGYFGDRCELTKDLFCYQSCLDMEDNPECDCDDLPPQYASSSEFLHSNRTSQCGGDKVKTITFICFGIVAVLVIALLSRKICVLSRRPRIKKRIIVNKGVKSQTPMTVRPSPASPPEQCEITIENCCNMNICETPCFEPNLRSSRSPTSKKTEDRKNLLKNMEEEDEELVDGVYS